VVSDERLVSSDQLNKILAVRSLTSLPFHALHKQAGYWRAACLFLLALLIYQLLSGSVAGHSLWPSATRTQRPLLYWMVIGGEAVVCWWLLVNYLAFA
jgi:hypothetical protein